MNKEHLPEKASSLPGRYTAAPYTGVPTTRLTTAGIPTLGVVKQWWFQELWWIPF